ncbi:MAG: sugar phosphate isomerase/epimerase [Gemmataceae bacterium]|nr:sugar phosphate isomerase/epimerase [Gemmataceae bacterium]
MSHDRDVRSDGCDRRSFLAAGVAGLSGLALAAPAAAQVQPQPQPAGKPTQFQVACMTLPYSQFPLRRALEGIRGAGYRYVAWGTSHREDGGKPVPVLPADAPPARAKELAARCRDMGLEPVMMFSGSSPDAKNGVEVLTRRVEQAAAARIPQVLTFGGTRGGEYKVWVERCRKLGPIARKNGVLIVIKQHGGPTGTGAACARITREVNDDGIRVNFDSGNVMDYNRVSPAEVIKDLLACADQVRSFCIKDHRDFPPPHGDCGPGLGEIDHYRLLHPVAFTGRAMPLCCENIFAPRVPRPTKPEGVDALARRAREFLELVIQGVQR